MRHLQLYELFNSSDIYDVILDDKKEYQKNYIEYRYYFVTKDGVEYDVTFSVDYGKGKLDFMTCGGPEDDKYNSVIQLINTHDSIKVFNTLKSIIDKHKDEIDVLIIHSTENRIIFYKKLVKYMKYDIVKETERQLVVKIK